MTKTRAMFEHALRFIVALGSVWGIAGCDGVDAAGDATDESGSPIVNGHPGGGVGVVRIEISNLQPDRNGFITIDVCSGTVISGNRIITAGHCTDSSLTIQDGGDTTVLLQGDLFAAVSYTPDGTNWVCLTNPAEQLCSQHSFAPMHVSRLGNGDFPPDIAVVRFASPLQSIRRAEFRELSTDSIRAKQSVEEWGAGFINAVGSAGGDVSPAMTRAVVRIASVAATTFKLPNNVSQDCTGDSGGPVFEGPSDLIVGILSSAPFDSRGKCAATSAQATAYRVTPSVITFIDDNRAGSDPVCHETIAGTGFFSCS